MKTGCSGGMGRQRAVTGFRGRRGGEYCVVMIRWHTNIGSLFHLVNKSRFSISSVLGTTQMTKARSLPSRTQSGRGKREGNQQYNSIGSEPCYRLLRRTSTARAWRTDTRRWERQGMLPRGRDMYAGVSKHDEQSPWQRAGEGPRSRAYVQRHAGQGDQGVAQKWKVVLCLQPEMCDGVSRGSRETVQERWTVTLILGLLGTVCILYGEWHSPRSDHLGGFVEDGLEKARQVTRRAAVMNSTWKDLTAWRSLVTP